MSISKVLARNNTKWNGKETSSSILQTLASEYIQEQELNFTLELKIMICMNQSKNQLISLHFAADSLVSWSFISYD